MCPDVEYELEIYCPEDRFNKQAKTIKIVQLQGKTCANTGLFSAVSFTCEAEADGRLPKLEGLESNTSFVFILPP